METLVPGLIGLTLFGLGGIYFARFIWLARCSRKWPVVEGTITQSWVRKWKQVKNGSQTSTYHYAPEVRYSYYVNGRELYGRNICFGREWNTSGGAADHTIAKYPVGKKVQVWHHPQRTELTTLETSASNRVYLMFAITFGMCVSILCGVMVGI